MAPVFPNLSRVVAWPVNRAPRWTVDDQRALSGKRTRTTYETYPTYDYEISFKVLRSAAAYQEYQSLAGFINQMYGGTGLFLYDDVNDDTATAQGFGAGDGVTTTFQLVRTFGGFSEPVFFPNAITDIKVAGTPTGAYTLSSTGQVIFNSAPANAAALTWDGTFRWGCRFDGDFKLSNFMQNLFNLKSLRFSTEKLL